MSFGDILRRDIYVKSVIHLRHSGRVVVHCIRRVGCCVSVEGPYILCTIVVLIVYTARYDLSFFATVQSRAPGFLRP
jgi:hypothetical protein